MPAPSGVAASDTRPLVALALLWLAGLYLRLPVLAAPPLQCLATATMWAEVFEPSVGGLAAFLHGRPELLVLEVQGGAVVRLPRGGVEDRGMVALGVRTGRTGGGHQTRLAT